MSIRESINVILEKDPAARSPLEVVLCYPGFHAVLMHRLAHFLWLHQMPTLGRFISHMGRVLTGIEIHPAAKIGHRFFIDHGMGVVIGETTEIGDDVVLYQGVTLGAGTAARMGAQTRGRKRHPTLGNGVIVGSGAEVQGNVFIGDNVRVASGSIVLKDVPANAVVVGVPGRVIYKDGEKVKDNVPDIEAEAIKCLKDKISLLEVELAKLKAHVAGGPHEGRAFTPKPESNKTAGELKGDLAGSALQDEIEDPVQVFLHGAGI
jgi:serine O-acetyltransferase